MQHAFLSYKAFSNAAKSLIIAGKDMLQLSQTCACIGTHLHQSQARVADTKMVCASAACFVVLQGHFQIALNKERCPLLQKRLSVGMRILYMSGVWSYIVGLTSTPTFIIIPLVSAPTFICCLGLQCSLTACKKYADLKLLLVSMHSSTSRSAQDRLAWRQLIDYAIAFM